jgi:hypothetical protein
MSEKDTDDRLYLQIDCPTLIEYLATHSDPTRGLGKLCISQMLTSVGVRKAFALKSPTITIWTYKGAMFELFQKMRTLDCHQHKSFINLLRTNFECESRSQ